MTEFDAAKHITKVSGRDYLEVKWRLVWLRTEHPDAQILTKLLQHEKNNAVFSCQVTLPSGASATGHGSEGADDFGDYLEKAETKAIGRALAALGFGTQFCDDLDFGSAQQRVVDAPVQRQQPAARPAAQAQPPQTGVQGGHTNQGAFKPMSDKQWNFINALAAERGLDAESGELLIWAKEHVNNGTRQDGSTYPVTIANRYEEWSTAMAAAVIGVLKDTSAPDLDVWRNGGELPVFRPNDDYGDVDFGGPDEG